MNFNVYQEVIFRIDGKASPRYHQFHVMWNDGNLFQVEIFQTTLRIPKTYVILTKNKKIVWLSRGNPPTASIIHEMRKKYSGKSAFPRFVNKHPGNIMDAYIDSNGDIIPKGNSYFTRELLVHLLIIVHKK